MRQATLDTLRLEGVHCTLRIERPAPGVLLVTLTGTDVGEFGRRPFEAMASDMTLEEPVELFIDARAGRAASIEVSAEWAAWLQAQREHLRCIHMLTATKFIQLSADLVRRTAGLEDRMRLYTDSVAFGDALQEARRRGGRS
jgi:hypothetical protein